MAVNRSRDLRTELDLGLVENSYMRLTPNRGGVVEHPRPERLSWPTYARVVDDTGASSCGCGGHTHMQ